MSVFFIAVTSANGKISRSHSSPIDWNSKEDLDWFKKITTRSKVIVMGRRTFELLSSPLPDRLNVVMTHNLPPKKMDNVLFTDASPMTLVKELKKKGYDKIPVVGGQKVFTSFLEEEIIDEMYITYEPILIEGIDMFDKIKKDTKMEVISVKKLNGGAFVTHYALKKRVGNGEI